ncbi:MAG: hypothetical protein KBF93_15355, partial [Leptospiraceae bacterium]|nr:hypothetical protein [Leptospiraceae bacterium]
TLQTEEKVIRNDYKPKYFLSDTDDYLEALITNVKVTLLKAGLDKKAREFIERVYKSKGNHHEIIRDYVIVIKPTPVNLTPKQAANARKKKLKTWKKVSEKNWNIPPSENGLY